MPGKTTRRTSSKKITAKIKPSKTKRKKGKGSKTVTAALNTYKSVKQKIFPGKRKKKSEASEEVNDIPVRKRMEYFGDKISAGERIKTASDNLNIDDKMDTPNNRLHGIVNRNDDPVDSELLSKRKVLDEVILPPSKRKKKKNNTLIYLLLAAVVIFAIYKMTAKK